MSDRKYLGYYPIAQAKAWLSGHGAVEASDLLALKNYLWRQPGDRAVVENVLTRLCVNPLQEKVNELRAAEREVFDELDSSSSAGVDSRKAFRKFRGEMLRIYESYKQLTERVQSDSEKALLDGLLADLEKDSRAAHEKNGYTYATLQEIEALQ